jgi:putative membrane protein
MAEKRNDLVAVVVIIVALAIVIPLLAWGWMGGMGMMGYGGGAMMLVPIAFVILIAMGVYFLLTTMMGSRGPEIGPETKALEALKERYAKGEITKEEYLKMKEEIGA